MNSKWIIYWVSLAAFLGPFTQTIYAPVLPEIREYFNTSYFLINLSISIFTVFLSVMQMIYGPLTDMKGRRNTLLLGLCIYIGASIGCYFSISIELFLFFRALQAVGIAAGSVVAVTVIGDLFEGKARGRAMGTFQMMVALGPVLGPVIGGFIGGLFDFHFLFLILALTGAFVLFVNWFQLKETKPQNSASDRFSPKDFIVILQNRTGLSIIILGFIQYYTFYTFIVFLPEILSTRYELSAHEKGLVFLPMSLLIVIGSFLGGRIQERTVPQKLLIGTTSLNVVSLIAFIFIANVSLLLLIITTAFVGLFLGLSLPVQTTLLTQSYVTIYHFLCFLYLVAGLGLLERGRRSGSGGRRGREGC